MTLLRSRLVLGLWALLLWVAPAHALEWGALQYVAASGKQPAYILARLQNVVAMDTSSLRVTVATPQAFAAAGLGYHPALAQARLSLVVYKGVTQSVDVRLDGLPSNVPTLDVLLTASDRSLLALAEYRVPLRGGNVVLAPSVPGTLQASARQPTVGPQTLANASAALQAWAQAWSRRDVDAYVAAYVPDYPGAQPEGARQSWLNEARARLLTPKRVQVRISDLHIEPQGQALMAVFKQGYKADNVNESSFKRVVLVNVQGRWLIQSEQEGELR